MRACFRNCCRVLVLALVLLGALLVPLCAAEGDGVKTLEAIPISETIKLDGVLDEPAWARAPVGTDFTQREPDTGQPASERTEISVVYTSKNLYIGVRCFDSQPVEIISKEMQRDQPLWRDDAIDFVLDTFDDDRNAYIFETNPNGAVTDALTVDEGRSFNLEWDGVWDAAARRNDEGWAAELVIPFSTLRFDPQASSWGFNVRRIIRRRAEEAYWSPIGLDGGLQRISLHGRLTGIRGVEQGWNLNVKPFVVGTSASSATDNSPSNSGERNGDDDELDFGLDVKWGFARGMSLDLTMNTDFGETEVDALQVNLTRFSLFFPEKREFFLENAGIFEFGPGNTGGGTPLLKVFFSRRIGISPQGEEVPIEWGARVTGRTGAWSIGLLDVQTDLTTLDSGGEVPRNNWGALRVTRNFGARSSFGMIVTQRDGGDNTNRAFGLDLDYNPSSRLGFDAYFVTTENSRPGAASDWSAGAGTTWDGSTWDWRIGWVRVGEDFDPQMGFLLRRGVYRYNSGVTYEPRPQVPWIMNLHFKADAQVFLDLDGTVETEEYRLDLVGIRTASADEATLFATRTYEHLTVPFQLGPDVVIPVGEYTFDTTGVSFLSHSSRPLSVEGSVEVGDFYDGDRLSGTLTLRLRPNRHVRSETTWEVNDLELPGGDFTATVLRQRLAVAITPKLLSNLFLQYNDLAELVSLNFRFNWIYRPGADLFVVYNQTWNAPSFSDLERQDRQIIVKFTYLFQR